MPAWLPLAIAGLALLVYAVAFDQGLLLEPLFGKAATADKFLHELFHDGRHLLGFPCHQRGTEELSFMALVLRRGLLAGLVAGLVSGVYLLFVGEPVIDQAIRLEAAASGGAQAAELLSRGTQRLGLVGAATLYGLAVGGVYALVHQLLEPRMAAGTAWDKALRLAAAGFGTLYLVPFLHYPANPPGVGDPSTAATRTRLYLAALVASVLISVAAWLAARRLAELGVQRWRRQLAVAAGYLVAVGLAYALLPQVPQRVAVPAELLWQARLASASGQALLWAVLGAAFGALAMNAERRAAATAASPARA